MLIQRVVPHYRRALFRRLHDELGWTVATGQPAERFGLEPVAAEDEPWLRVYPFGYSARRQYAARVPLAAIRRDLQPAAIVAEFSLHMSSSWALAGAGAIGRGPRLAFWSQGRNVERGFRHPIDLASQAARLALLRQADAQLCYTEEGAAYLRRWLPAAQPIFVAPNTLDASEFPGREQDRSPAAAGEAHLLCVGRVTADKRVPLVIAAVRALLATMPGVRLTIVGDGPDMPAVRAAAQGLEANVTLHGAVYDQRTLAELFGAATLLVIGGAAGLNVNHALAYGVPVMLFDDAAAVRHHPEHAFVVDGVSGFRVAPFGQDALVARLREVLAQDVSPRRRLQAGLRAQVKRDLSFDRMIDGFRALHDYLTALPPR